MIKETKQSYSYIYLKKICKDFCNNFTIIPKGLLLSKKYINQMTEAMQIVLK